MAGESFGVESLATSIEGQGDTPDTQAGSHPASLTTTIMFDHVVTEEYEDFEENVKEEIVPLGEPEVFADIYGNPKHLELSLPAGLVVDLAALKIKCTEAQLETNPSSGGSCPAASAVGVITVYRNGFGEKTKAAIYDMEPQAGVPAELGVDAGEAGLIVHAVGKLSADGSRFSAEVSEISQSTSIYGLALTLWGDPSDPSHDAQRGPCASSGTALKGIEKERYENENLLFGKSEGKYRFSCPTEEAAAPLLTLPGACTAEPLQTTLSVDSWQEPGELERDGAPDPSDPRWHTATATSPPLTGCAALGFAPSLSVQPSPQPSAAESPTGLNVDLRIPREESVTGLAAADPRSVTLTLPAGMAISPSVAGGLGTCTDTPEPGRPEGQIALHSGEPVACPNASKLGEVEVRTPLLSAPLTGGVYLAQPESFAESSSFALYLVAAGDGVTVKLVAQATLDPLTGQIALALDELPQLPLSEIRLTVFGGPRAALQTPPGCGTYTATAELTPWSGGPAAEPGSSFAIDAGCAHPFAPSLLAGTTDTRAGAATAFSATISLQEGEQPLRSIDILEPPGLLAALGDVARCEEPQAASGACPAASEIGEVTLAVGPGPDPYWVRGGRVYLTGPYEGAPFGLLVLVQVNAGPLDLGQVRVRARVQVDPHTAQLEISSDPLPTILRGIPLDVRAVNLTIDRAGGAPFMFDPTDCAPFAVTGTFASADGAIAQASSPFEATDCASLPFKPTVAAYTSAGPSRTQGASLSLRIDSGPGQIDVGKLRAILPAQLAGRLSTLQKACPFATFNADPAACPADSVVGTGAVVTRVLAEALSGPAYLVSHGGGAFPDVVLVLRGAGITMYLDGNLDIRGRLTSATFDSIPDVPIDTFAVTFPEGPHSILTAALPARAHGSMCGQRLRMPVEISGQDGALLTPSVPVFVTGCPRRSRHGRHRETGRERRRRKTGRR